MSALTYITIGRSYSGVENIIRTANEAKMSVLLVDNENIETLDENKIENIELIGTEIKYLDDILKKFPNNVFRILYISSGYEARLKRFLNGVGENNTEKQSAFKTEFEKINTAETAGYDDFEKKYTSGNAMYENVVAIQEAKNDYDGDLDSRAWVEFMKNEHRVYVKIREMVDIVIDNDLITTAGENNENVVIFTCDSETNMPLPSEVPIAIFIDISYYDPEGLSRITQEYLRIKCREEATISNN